jgi:hypothetical protein
MLAVMVMMEPGNGTEQIYYEESCEYYSQDFRQ